MAFIKTFTDDEFNSIYAEREWRSINPFSFTNKDLAGFILPKKGGYIDRFENDLRKTLRIPSSIPVYDIDKL